MAVGMEFVNHMCNNASDENLKPRSPVLLNGMVKLMEGAVEPEVSDFINVALQRGTGEECGIWDWMSPILIVSIVVLNPK